MFFVNNRENTDSGLLPGVTKSKMAESKQTVSEMGRNQTQRPLMVFILFPLAEKTF